MATTREVKINKLNKTIENMTRQLDIEKSLLAQKEGELAILFQETRINLLKVEIICAENYLEQLSDLEGLLNKT